MSTTETVETWKDATSRAIGFKLRSIVQDPEMDLSESRTNALREAAARLEGEETRDDD